MIWIDAISVINLIEKVVYGTWVGRKYYQLRFRNIEFEKVV